jgi:hypothetical protein
VEKIQEPNKYIEKNCCAKCPNEIILTGCKEKDCGNDQGVSDEILVWL